MSAQHVCTLARVRECARHDQALARYGKCNGGKCGCGEKTPCTIQNNKDPKRAKPTKFKWVPGDVPLTPGKMLSHPRSAGRVFSRMCALMSTSCFLFASALSSMVCAGGNETIWQGFRAGNNAVEEGLMAGSRVYPGKTHSLECLRYCLILFIHFEERLMAGSRIYPGGTLFGMPEVFSLLFVIYFYFMIFGMPAVFYVMLVQNVEYGVMHLSLPNPLQRERFLLGKLHWEVPHLLRGNRSQDPRFHPPQARTWLTYSKYRRDANSSACVNSSRMLWTGPVDSFQVPPSPGFRRSSPCIYLDNVCKLVLSALTIHAAFTHTHRQADCMYAVKRAICAYHFWECDASYGAQIYNGICEPTCTDIPVSIRLRGRLCRAFSASKLSCVYLPTV